MRRRRTVAMAVALFATLGLASAATAQERERPRDSNRWETRRDWKVHLSREAQERLHRLRHEERERVERALDRLHESPFEGQVTALRGRWKGRFVKSVGRYNLVFIPFPREHRVEVVSLLLRRERRDRDEPRRKQPRRQAPEPYGNSRRY